MQLTFEHLLGLPASAALAILTASGITGVEVVPTAAPKMREDAHRNEAGEAAGYAETRVVAVEEDGRRLIVSRFLTAIPEQRRQKDGTDALRAD